MFVCLSDHDALIPKPIFLCLKIALFINAVCNYLFIYLTQTQFNY